MQNCRFALTTLCRFWKDDDVNDEVFCFLPSSPLLLHVSMLNVDYELNFTYIICISLYLLHKSARVTSMKNIFNYLNMLTNKLQASNSDIESSTSNFLSIIEFLEFLSLLHVNVDSFIFWFVR